jgi:hypothetical protein
MAEMGQQYALGSARLDVSIAPFPAVRVPTIGWFSRPKAGNVPDTDERWISPWVKDGVEHRSSADWS